MTHTLPWAGIEVPTLHSVVARHAAERSGAPATLFEGRALTYGELDTLANRAAAMLAARGIEKGETVIHAGRNSDAVPVMALACNRIGAIPVPLNWRLASDEMSAIATDCAARLILHDDEFGDCAREIAAALGVPSLPSQALFRHEGGPADDLEAHDAEATALIVYTSGTTGNPKGVLLSHRALLGINVLRPTLDWDRWSEDDVTLVSAPLGHIGAYGMMARTLLFGGLSVIQRQFGVEETLDAIPADGITKLALVPTAIKMLLDHPRSAEIDYASLDTIVYGSAPITPDLLRRAIAAFGCRFAQSYGQSETAGPTVALPPDDHDVRGNERMTGAGRPLPATELKIVDERGRSLPTGQTGEIWIRSIANMSGYLNRPEETAKALDAAGWVHTGDAGFLDPDGYLYVRGRLKEMIITGAENVYPAEVENALAEHPGIAEVAVVGIPDPHWGEAVTAIVVVAADNPPGGDDLREWLRGKLAGYKIPKTFRFADALPLTPMGKIDKAALLQRFGPPA
ncbi:acyl-CoA synthetase [Novosphingobium marinum]|uniref:3-methylmercaptopropionyl-CoA ligase n=1 Tax=Novosphingobium marinum TaxID=1514948 RepID=A0A7Y9XT72_9SPHN|nr:AMP-binding protein [Novosphingobium marinum]NYH94032.1 acyl-CoA synthetase (AMP-forming)/AMP-acid ligase II [Novosphingobium marinum]GGC19091.1 acyl-CoA synthetase [Novosphingobium marinum]